MKYYIYTLEHPITNEIRYVGRTNNIKGRLATHLYSSKTGTTHKDRWINSLIKIGLKPIIKVLDELDSIEECLKTEEYWIAQFKAWDFQLTNYCDGGSLGMTGKTLSKEAREKISRSLKERFSKNPPNKGIKRTEEQKLARSIALKGKPMKCSPKGISKNHLRKLVTIYKDGIKIDEILGIKEACSKYSFSPNEAYKVLAKKIKATKGYYLEYSI